MVTTGCLVSNKTEARVRTEARSGPRPGQDRGQVRTEHRKPGTPAMARPCPRRRSNGGTVHFLSPEAQAPLLRMGQSVASVPGTRVIAPDELMQTSAAKVSPALVTTAVPPVTEPVASSSVLPDTQRP